MPIKYLGKIDKENLMSDKITNISDLNVIQSSNCVPSNKCISKMTFDKPEENKFQRKNIKDFFGRINVTLPKIKRKIVDLSLKHYSTKRVIRRDECNLLRKINKISTANITLCNNKTEISSTDKTTPIESEKQGIGIIDTVSNFINNAEFFIATDASNNEYKSLGSLVQRSGNDGSSCIFRTCSSLLLETTDVVVNFENKSTLNNLFHATPPRNKSAFTSSHKMYNKNVNEQCSYASKIIPPKLQALPLTLDTTVTQEITINGSQADFNNEESFHNIQELSKGKYQNMHKNKLHISKLQKRPLVSNGVQSCRKYIKIESISIVRAPSCEPPTENLLADIGVEVETFQDPSIKDRAVFTIEAPEFKFRNILHDITIDI